MSEAVWIRLRALPLLLAAVAILGAGLPRPAEAAKPGGGGGGVATCPADRLSFFPANGTQLQAALDCADAGATITLQAGVLYEGTFTLRYKPVAYEADGITPRRIAIVSSALTSLPPQRVSPLDESHMALLRVPAGSSGPLVSTELKTLPDNTRLAASHYQFAGLKFFTNHWVNQVVRLGTTTERLLSELPDDISFDRSYFAGSAGEGTKQGLVANGRNIVVTNSYFKDFKDTANDAQAIGVWNGAGPFLIKNNYLEGSGENVMFGGGDPSIEGLVPSDITIVGNYFFKPLRWTDETSTQKGGARRKKWRIKNLFELKNAERVVFDGNVLENNWIQADQQGFAVNISPRNQSGGCPWCRIHHVQFTNNLIKNSIAGIKFLATDDTFPSGQLQNFEFRNNLLININAAAVPGPDPGDRAGRFVQIMNLYPSVSSASSPTGPIDLRIEHNTAFATREVTFSVWGPVAGVAFKNNVARHNVCTTSNNCGMSGDGTAPGDPTFTEWFHAPLAVSGNTLFAAGGDQASRYTQFPENVFPDAVTFKSSCDLSNPIDLTTGQPTSEAQPADYHVVAGPGNCDTYVFTSDGSNKKVGADWDVLKRLIESAISGQ